MCADEDVCVLMRMCVRSTRVCADGVLLRGVRAGDARAVPAPTRPGQGEPTEPGHRGAGGWVDRVTVAQVGGSTSCLSKHPLKQHFQRQEINTTPHQPI